MALEARAKIQQGGDPARDKQLARIERAGDLTIRAVVDDYRAKVLPTLAPATQRLREICLSSIVSRLGGIPASSLTGGDVVLLLERISQQSTYVMAEKSLQVLRHVIQHGQAKRVIAADPTAGIKTAAVLGKRPPTRKRVMLTEAQIRELMADTELSEIPSLVLKIQLGTGTRVGEMVSARWEHVDVDAGTWTIPTSKTSDEPFTIPLSAPVLRWFGRLRHLSCSSEWVVPGASKGHRTADSIRAAINDRPYSPHDMRSTCRSWLDALGVNPEIAERCLNHHVPGLVGVYNRHDYLPERRRAMDLLGEFLTACEECREWSPTGSNVVPIRQSA